MMCRTMGLKSKAYIIMTKLTDLHCNAESQVIFQHLHHAQTGSSGPEIPKMRKGLPQLLPVTCATTAWEILRLARKALISSFITLLSLLPKQNNNRTHKKRDRPKRTCRMQNFLYLGDKEWGRLALKQCLSAGHFF